MTAPPPSRWRPPRIVATVFFTAAVALAGVATSAAADTTHRLEASTNVGAAIAWSEFSFAPGATSTALLARDDVFADSLASGTAQAQLNAPLLLTNGDVLDPRVLAELNRLGVRHVVVLGGTAAVSPAVVTTLEATGYSTERVSGPTRTETAIEVARRLFPAATQAVVARAYAGDDPTQAFADTLPTGSFAAATAMPILFTESEQLTETTRSYLMSSPIEFITVAGGAGAVSDSVVEQLRQILAQKEATGDVTRAAGPNRFATAIEMAAAVGVPSVTGADAVVLIDASREDSWASGFPAAIQSAGGDTPVVLANGNALPPETQAYLADANGRIPLICGPYTSNAACTAAAQAMGNE